MDRLHQRGSLAEQTLGSRCNMCSSRSRTIDRWMDTQTYCSALYTYIQFFQLLSLYIHTLLYQIFLSVSSALAHRLPPLRTYLPIISGPDLIYIYKHIKVYIYIQRERKRDTYKRATQRQRERGREIEIKTDIPLEYIYMCIFPYSCKLVSV